MCMINGCKNIKSQEVTVSLKSTAFTHVAVQQRVTKFWVANYSLQSKLQSSLSDVFVPHTPWFCNTVTDELKSFRHTQVWRSGCNSRLFSLSSGSLHVFDVKVLNPSFHKHTSRNPGSDTAARHRQGVWGLLYVTLNAVCLCSLSITKPEHIYTSGVCVCVCVTDNKNLQMLQIRFSL